MQLKEDCLFIADSHYNSNRQELKLFLNKLLKKEINTSQLVLMGDMFDFLSPQIKFFVKQNNEVINLLNDLSKDIEIIYLEGNHDFNLKTIFPNIKIIARQNQPLMCKYNDKITAIAHGDIFTPKKYDIYTAIIRNKMTLFILNLFDINNWISNRVNNWLLNKKLCSKCKDFELFAQHRISLYPTNIDLIIEGHFHFGDNFLNYVNVPSLTCDGKYFRGNFKN